MTLKIEEIRHDWALGWVRNTRGEIGLDLLRRIHFLAANAVQLAISVMALLPVSVG
jgi:hypothetical protein